MDAPKCPLCEKRHWGNCPDSYGKSPAGSAILTAKAVADLPPEVRAPASAAHVKARSARKQAKPELTPAAAENATQTPPPEGWAFAAARQAIEDVAQRYAATPEHCPTCGQPIRHHTFDKTTYMREYMRKRRAADKAVKQQG